MSAFSHTSWTVYCNAPGCKKQVTDEGDFARKVSRASLRRYLARRGWAVNVDAATRTDGKDFCPDHAEMAATQAAGE